MKTQLLIMTIALGICAFSQIEAQTPPPRQQIKSGTTQTRNEEYEKTVIFTGKILQKFAGGLVIQWIRDESPPHATIETADWIKPGDWVYVIQHPDYEKLATGQTIKVRTHPAGIVIYSYASKTTAAPATPKDEEWPDAGVKSLRQFTCSDAPQK